MLEKYKDILEQHPGLTNTLANIIKDWDTLPDIDKAAHILYARLKFSETAKTNKIPYHVIPGELTNDGENKKIELIN